MSTLDCEFTYFSVVFALDYVCLALYSDWLVISNVIVWIIGNSSIKYSRSSIKKNWIEVIY